MRVLFLNYSLGIHMPLSIHWSLEYYIREEASLVLHISILIFAKSYNLRIFENLALA